MHIVLTVNFSPWSDYSGGGQLSTHQLANALGALDHEVEVIYTKPPWEKIKVTETLSYQARFTPFCGLKSRRQAMLRPLNALFVAAAVNRALSRCRGARHMSVVHSQGEEGALIPFLRRRHSFKFVVTPRYPNPPDILLNNHSSFTGKMALYLYDYKYIALGHALKAADKVCMTSQAAALRMSKAYGLDEKRCCIIPNGINPVFLADRRAVDARNGPILFFGRLSKSKGPDVLLEALAFLPSPQPRTVLVGRGELLDSLKRRVRILGLEQIVSILPWQSACKLSQLLSSASMAVLPSLEESFGNTMLEAMAAGVPLISTTAGSIPEIVEQEHTGLLVPPGDPSALAASIVRLQKNPDYADHLGKTGKRYVNDHFSWSSVAHHCLSLYRDLGATL